jgi:uncharacterized protein YdhG (YjbR/CyaY superfamily)
MESDMKAAPATIDDYLAPLPADQRAALQDLRRQILAAAPGASECISYGMPGFRLNGVLVWMGAGKAHCAFYPSGLVADFKDRLVGYETSKGAIRFQPGKPLPEDLVRDIVKRRVTEDAAKAAARRARARKPKAV